MLEFYCYFSPQYNFSSRSIIQNASQMITQIIDTCPSLLPVRRHLEWEEYSFFFFYVENFCVNYWNIFSGAQGYAALVKWVCNSIHCCKRHSQAGWKQRERKRKKKKTDYRQQNYQMHLSHYSSSDFYIHNTLFIFQHNSSSGNNYSLWPK